MRVTMLCGAGSFSGADDKDDPWPPPTPRASRRRHGSSRNPYSTRGLDKFSTLLADLETRREQIVAKAAGAQGVPVVRFVYYSNSQDWVPVVVRSREQRPELENPKKSAKSQKKPNAATRKQPPPRPAEQMVPRAEPAAGRVVEKSISWKLGTGEGAGSRWLLGWKPSYHWPAVVVLILLCLVFGRAFAICCTSIWWYLVPSVKVGDGPDVRRSTKEDCRRRMSDRKLGAGGGDGLASTGKRRALLNR